MKNLNKEYDVAVIGAGPAGSIAAGCLASNGHSVILIDKEDFLRDKVCGDGIVGDSIRILKEVGIWNTVRDKSFGAEVVELFPFKNRSFVINSPVYTLRRKEFDKLLKEWAVGNGAEFKRAKFNGKINKENVCSELEIWDFESDKNTSLNAKIIILAMGCQPGSFVVEKINKQIQIKSDIVAIRGYCKADWNIDHPMVFFEYNMGQGYVWIFPMGDNTYNVGCGSKNLGVPLKKLLEQFLRTNKYTNKASIEWTEKPRGAFLNTSLCNLKCAVSDNVLLVGETLGATYPFTGEGIGKALETGYLAAQVASEAINENNMEKLNFYPDLLKEKIEYSYKAYKAAEKLLYKKKLNKILFFFVCSSKTISNYIGDIVSERKRAQDIALFRIVYSIASIFSKK